MKTQLKGDHVNIEVAAKGITLWQGRFAVYLDEEMLRRIFVAAAVHKLIDAQQIMSKVYDN